MRLFLVILLTHVFFFAVGQSEEYSKKVYRFKSKISRVESNNAQTGQWEKQDYLIDHVVVVDLNQNKIRTYSDKLSNDLDLILPCEKSEKGTIYEYEWNAVNENGVQCKATLSWLNNEAFFLKIKFQNYILWFFIDK